MRSLWTASSGHDERPFMAYHLQLVSPIVARPYAGAGDLRRMQALVARAFRTTPLHVGDLAWLARNCTQREFSLYIRLWEDGGRLIGSTFSRPNGGFNVFVAPGCADDGLLDEMLAVVDGGAKAAVLAGDPPVDLYTYGIDVSRSVEDRSLAAALERHGFTPQPNPGGVLSRTLDALPPAIAPPGYRLHEVRSPEHILGRIETHRLAFVLSELTFEKYRRVRRTWPYRPELDRVALCEDGSVAAFCTAWLDAENGVGLLEPVGTHPTHRRRGLARAICLDAFHVLRDAGARTVHVGFSTDAALATYQSIGCRRLWADTVFRRAQAPTHERPIDVAVT